MCIIVFDLLYPKLAFGALMVNMPFMSILEK